MRKFLQFLMVGAFLMLVGQLRGQAVSDASEPIFRKVDFTIVGPKRVDYRESRQVKFLQNGVVIYEGYLKEDFVSLKLTKSQAHYGRVTLELERHTYRGHWGLAIERYRVEDVKLKAYGQTIHLGKYYHRETPHQI